MYQVQSDLLNLLQNRLDLEEIPFTERGSRLLIYYNEDGFHVHLAERWTRTHGKYAYRERPRLMYNIQLLNADGNELPINLTTYPHAVLGQSAIGALWLNFADEKTLTIVLPSAASGIRFTCSAHTIKHNTDGGTIQTIGEQAYTLHYRSSTPIMTTNPQHNGDDLTVTLYWEAAPDEKTLHLQLTSDEKAAWDFPQGNALLQASEQRWHGWLGSVPPVPEPHRAMYYFCWWVMLAGTLSPRGHITREAMTASKTRMLGIWHWDSFFHALAYQHFDTKLAQDQLLIWLDHQREDGFLPDSLHDWEVISRSTFSDADMTKPPLFAWAAWKMHQTQADYAFLRAIYKQTVQWNNWWFTHCDANNNGLCEYHHPYASGLDDSPLWDGGMPVESPDLNTYLTLHQDALAHIAAELGDESAAYAWQSRAATLSQRMIDQRWDAEASLFWAVDGKGQRVPVRTLFNLFPFITGRMTPEIEAQSIEHLTDESAFWAAHPFPSVAMDDPTFDPDQMWRGPTWTPTNYLIYDGLLRIGRTELAHTLRDRTLSTISAHNNVYEYYNPITGAPPPKAYPMVGWSAAVYIVFVLSLLTDSNESDA